MIWKFNPDSVQWYAESKLLSSTFWYIDIFDDGSFDLAKTSPFIAGKNPPSFYTLTEAKAWAEEQEDKLILKHSGKTVDLWKKYLPKRRKMQ